MKSIENILKIVREILSFLKENDKVYCSLVGGYAVIAHGVERTTTDVDFCIYSEVLAQKGMGFFINLLRKILPKNFDIRFVEGSKMPDDPFGHDILFVEDTQGKHPRIDFIVTRYKWELEGTKKAKPLKDFDFPVMPKSYLVAMKLKAGSLKDDFDSFELYQRMTPKEKEEIQYLSKLIHKDKKLKALIEPREVREKDEDGWLI
ncbi:MAG: hypothetical protein HYS08_02925 [Chlamydiae bacterium]|nr:hypothetical protein [Chlamydiota bacterium]